ncbi:MAG: glycine--tRNA ligase subunit beta [Firmicutes bacterium]|nr:glycine--tRNA ligase subunit beta [Bacillota bacterium]
MTSRDLLVEIGFEEMPAAYIPSAVNQMREKAAKMLDDLRLTPAGTSGPTATAVRVLATPRRLALLCSGVPGAQGERTVEVRGPSKSVALTPDGGFSSAAMGFARSQGVKPGDLVVRQTPAGEYVFAVKVDKGRPAAQVLAEAIPALIMALEFPKSMRWGLGEHAFARPVRWLLALLGRDPIEFEVLGVKSGRLTYGHRVLGPGPFEIGQPGEYEDVLARAGVVVDQDKRRKMIEEQVAAVAAAEGGAASVDPALLEQVNYLVEYPAAFAGGFSPDYLVIPTEVLVTTMQHHQRYFPVYDAGGPPAGGGASASGGAFAGGGAAGVPCSGRKLKNCFIAVRNGGSEGLDIVRTGNERVIRARLADAAFFFAEDQKTPLGERVDLLKRVLFQEKMGTYFDKTERVRQAARKIAAAAGISGAALELVDRAAVLSKTDLTTNMVREFPELQGTMGREYGRRQGEDEEVCAALAEQYLPRHAGGDLPATRTGAVLSLADKVDTICGCFLAGITPTGSQDPYALRRQGAGIVSILAAGASGVGGGVRAPLSLMVRSALDLLAPSMGAGEDRVLQEQSRVLEFLKGRVRAFLEDDGIRYDVLDAVLEAGFDDVPSTVARARALQAFLQEEEFARMMVGFKRVANLAREVAPAEVDVRLFAQPEEKALYDSFLSTKGSAEQMLRSEDYASFFKHMAGLREPVDRFLDQVLVMAEDPAVRRNRLALLSNITGLFGRAADLSRVVVS